MLKSNLGASFPPSVQIALIGNPNAGKSTLFNRLTGSNQQIGNWPGVTIAQKNGKYFDRVANLNVNVVDLPGCYSLIATVDMPLDEQITCKYLVTAENTVFVNVVDAAHLSRDLYLTLQLLELGVPVIVALNCIDLAKSAGIKIKIDRLAQMLGCPVVPIIAKTGREVVSLQQQIAITANTALVKQNTYNRDFPALLNTTLDEWKSHVTAGQGVHVLEGDSLLAIKLMAAGIEVDFIRNKLAQQISAPLDLFIAKSRREQLKNILSATITKRDKIKSSISEYIDAVVLHKVLGPLIFMGIMYLMFTFAINLGGVLQLAFDQASENLFVTKFSLMLSSIGAAPWVVDVLANGLGKGLNITVTFVPVLSAMFLSLGILESSGYMMRAAFIVDRLMRLLGLSGRSLVPMIVGFGCNVPAIMGARSLANRRERILTIMMTPFMSCSARLAIYAIFVAAFFPIGGQNIIFSLYVVGILVAVLTGYALRTTVLANERAPSLMEMPDYRWPLISTLIRQVWSRLRGFLIKAGALIIILCILINGIGYDTLEIIGKAITPVFAPMGISADNWPATVGLLTGLIAKEAVVGTLNATYSESSMATEMVASFGSTTAAYAYLLFTLLYFPCASVVAVIAKELNKKWALFSVVWSTGLAYIIATLFYQLATWSSFMSASSAWIVCLLAALSGFFIAARFIAFQEQQAVSKYKAIPTVVNYTSI